MDSTLADQMQNLPDAALIELSQSGAAEAFGELVERNRTGAIKVAMAILRDRHDAEDEIQNAFCKAFEHIGQFQREAKFSTWLTRIVVNQCLMRLRQARRAKFIYLEQPGTVEELRASELPDARVSAEQQLGLEQVSEVLRLEIRRTPPLLRSVFLLRDVEERPMPEVAERLGISVPAAKSRLLRARAELRRRLSRHYGRIGPATLMA